MLTGFGINCEEEMAAAYRLAGAEATIVHLNEVLHGRVSIHDFDVLNFPGGFSFGDDLGSGVVLANKLRYRQVGGGVEAGTGGRTLLTDIQAFVASGKFVLGICNGFQVLVKLGLLPNLGGDFRPEMTLTHNASGRYENRWVRLQVNPLSTTPFLRGLTTLEVPVRHGEGRLVVPDAATREQLEKKGLNCLSYVDAAGDGTSAYPFNPNGADLNCAGLQDATGRIFGLMPHPEAYLAACNHPDWGRRKRGGSDAGEVGEGLAIFRNIVEFISSALAPLASNSISIPLAPFPETPSPSPFPDGEGGLIHKTDVGLDIELETRTRASSPSPSGKGLGDGVSGKGLSDGVSGKGLTDEPPGNTDHPIAEEPRPHYARRQQPTAAPTSIPDNVFTASPKQWERVKSLSRAMRQDPTPAENALWQALRGQQLGVKFRRQHAVDSFVVDFISLPDKLIIEVDGAVHAEAQQAAYDAGRTEILRELGYRVLRFANEAVFSDLPGVLSEIKQALIPTTLNV